jgi:2-keto-4-pentenoate hydratase
MAADTPAQQQAPAAGASQDSHEAIRATYQAFRENPRTEEVASILLQARRACRPLETLDAALLPASLLEAYAVQDTMAAHLGAVGGWTIGAPQPDATPLYGPMALALGFVSNGKEMPGSMSRMRGVEAEIGFLLLHDLPVRAERYTRDEVRAAIASVHPVIEVLESAFVAPDAVNHLAMVADLQMNGGFVHGPACKNWQGIDWDSEPIEIVIDGIVRWDKPGRNTNGPDYLRLLEYLANEGQFRTGGLRAGQWITTGSWMGKLLAHGRSSVEVRFAHIGNVAFSFAK